MTLFPINQKNLYGLENELNELITLYKNAKLPNKILLSGQKGIGKSTLAYHLINYILSNNEDFSYDLNKYLINDQNRSFKLIQNNSNPNFTLIDVPEEKKVIDINQIRSLISNLKKSSFNDKPRFVLIDNIEYLNTNSINALLKILEEPSENVFFILIHNNKKILPTLKSRCLDFKISLSNSDSYEISKQIIRSDISNFISEDLLDYYFTPGKIYNLVKFSQDNNLNLQKLNLINFLKKIIDEGYYKKESSIRFMINDFVELFLVRTLSNSSYDIFSYFSKKFSNVKKFNLDEESFYLEFKEKILNG